MDEDRTKLMSKRAVIKKGTAEIEMIIEWETDEIEIIEIMMTFIHPETKKHYNAVEDLASDYTGNDKALLELIKAFENDALFISAIDFYNEDYQEIIYEHVGS